MHYVLVFIVSASLLVACGHGETGNKQAQESPATVAHEAHEEDLATVKLSPEAVARLGLETAPIERKLISLHRIVGGELLSPVGGRLTVSAPLGGYVMAPGTSDNMPSPGTTLKAGQAVLRLLPVDSVQQTLSALEEVGVRETEAQVAQARARRVAELVEDGLSTQEELDVVNSELAQVRSNLRVARAQRELLLGQAGGGADGLTSINVTSPVTGVLVDLSVAPRQPVALGDPLFTVEERHRLWVKVPLYAGDIKKVDLSQSAAVSPIDDWGSGHSREAVVVDAPGSANAGAASVDLYYEIANSDKAYQPGERVSVKLPMLSEGERLTVPFSAIFRDIHNGAWVYEEIAANTYVRTRVMLAAIEGDVALLADGPEPGRRVVVVGVAELAGTEFGVGH